MIRTFKIFAALGIGVFFTACKETPPYINMELDPNIKVDTSYVLSAETPQAKNVLIEDFTGVRCGNCPKGHEVIEVLRKTWGHRVVALATHGYAFENFTTPYPGATDFRTVFGNRIFDIIGKPSGLPFASMDRSVKGSNTTQWKSAAENLLQTVPTLANIYITGKSLTEDADSVFIKDDQGNIIDTQLVSKGDKFLNGRFKIALTEAFTEDLFVSIALIENNIVSPQLVDPHGVNQTYKHNHVLRDYPVFRYQLNPGSGKVNDKGRVYEGSFYLNVKSAKVSANSAIVFILHKSKEVLQVLEEELY